MFDSFRPQTNYRRKIQIIFGTIRESRQQRKPATSTPIHWQTSTRFFTHFGQMIRKHQSVGTDAEDVSDVIELQLSLATAQKQLVSKEDELFSVKRSMNELNVSHLETQGHLLCKKKAIAYLRTTLYQDLMALRRQTMLLEQGLLFDIQNTFVYNSNGTGGAASHYSPPQMDAQTVAEGQAEFPPLPVPSSRLGGSPSGMMSSRLKQFSSRYASGGLGSSLTSSSFRGGEGNNNSNNNASTLQMMRSPQTPRLANNSMTAMPGTPVGSLTSPTTTQQVTATGVGGAILSTNPPLPSHIVPNEYDDFSYLDAFKLLESDDDKNMTEEMIKMAVMTARNSMKRMQESSTEAMERRLARTLLGLKEAEEAYLEVRKQLQNVEMELETKTEALLQTVAQEKERLKELQESAISEAEAKFEDRIKEMEEQLRLGEEKSAKTLAEAESIKDESEAKMAEMESTFVNHKKEVAMLKGQVAKEREECLKATKALDAATAEREKGAAALRDLQQRLDDEREANRRLVVQTAKLREELNATQAALTANASTEQQLQQLQRQLKSLKQANDKQKEQMDELSSKNEMLVGEMADARDEVTQRHKIEAELKAKLDASYEKEDKLRDALVNATGGEGDDKGLEDILLGLGNGRRASSGGGGVAATAKISDGTIAKLFARLSQTREAEEEARISSGSSPSQQQQSTAAPPIISSSSLVSSSPPSPSSHFHVEVLRSIESFEDLCFALLRSLSREEQLRSRVRIASVLSSPKNQLQQIRTAFQALIALLPPEVLTAKGDPRDPSNTPDRTIRSGIEKLYELNNYMDAATITLLSDGPLPWPVNAEDLSAASAGLGSLLSLTSDGSSLGAKKGGIEGCVEGRSEESNATGQPQAVSRPSSASATATGKSTSTSSGNGAAGAKRRRPSTLGKVSAKSTDAVGGEGGSEQSSRAPSPVGAAAAVIVGSGGLLSPPSPSGRRKSRSLVSSTSKAQSDEHRLRYPATEHIDSAYDLRTYLLSSSTSSASQSLLPPHVPERYSSRGCALQFGLPCRRNIERWMGMGLDTIIGMPNPHNNNKNAEKRGERETPPQGGAHQPEVGGTSKGKTSSPSQANQGTPPPPAPTPTAFISGADVTPILEKAFRLRYGDLTAEDVTYLDAIRTSILLSSAEKAAGWAREHEAPPPMLSPAEVGDLSKEVPFSAAGKKKQGESMAASRSESPPDGGRKASLGDDESPTNKAGGLLAAEGGGLGPRRASRRSSSPTLSSSTPNSPTNRKNSAVTATTPHQSAGGPKTTSLTHSKDAADAKVAAGLLGMRTEKKIKAAGEKGDTLLGPSLSYQKKDNCGADGGSATPSPRPLSSSSARGQRGGRGGGKRGAGLGRGRAAEAAPSATNSNSAAALGGGDSAASSRPSTAATVRGEGGVFSSPTPSSSSLLFSSARRKPANASRPGSAFSAAASDDAPSAAPSPLFAFPPASRGDGGPLLGDQENIIGSFLIREDNEESIAIVEDVEMVDAGCQWEELNVPLPSRPEGASDEPPNLKIVYVSMAVGPSRPPSAGDARMHYYHHGGGNIRGSTTNTDQSTLHGGGGGEEGTTAASPRPHSATSSSRGGGHLIRLKRVTSINGVPTATEAAANEFQTSITTSAKLPIRAATPTPLGGLPLHVLAHAQHSEDGAIIALSDTTTTDGAPHSLRSFRLMTASSTVSRDKNAERNWDESKANKVSDVDAEAFIVDDNGDEEDDSPQSGGRRTCTLLPFGGDTSEAGNHYQGDHHHDNTNDGNSHATVHPPHHQEHAVSSHTPGSTPVPLRLVEGGSVKGSIRIANVGGRAYSLTTTGGHSTSTPASPSRLPSVRDLSLAIEGIEERTALAGSSRPPTASSARGSTAFATKRPSSPTLQKLAVGGRNEEAKPRVACHDAGVQTIPWRESVAFEVADGMRLREPLSQTPPTDSENSTLLDVLQKLTRLTIGASEVEKEEAARALGNEGGVGGSGRLANVITKGQLLRPQSAPLAMNTTSNTHSSNSSPVPVNRFFSNTDAQRLPVGYVPPQEVTRSLTAASAARSRSLLLRPVTAGTNSGCLYQLKTPTVVEVGVDVGVHPTSMNASYTNTSESACEEGAGDGGENEIGGDLNALRMSDPVAHRQIMSRKGRELADALLSSGVATRIVHGRDGGGGGRGDGAADENREEGGHLYEETSSTALGVSEQRRRPHTAQTAPLGNRKQKGQEQGSIIEVSIARHDVRTATSLFGTTVSNTAHIKRSSSSNNSSGRPSSAAPTMAAGGGGAIGGVRRPLLRPSSSSHDKNRTSVSATHALVAELVGSGGVPAPAPSAIATSVAFGEVMPSAKWSSVQSSLETHWAREAAMVAAPLRETLRPDLNVLGMDRNDRFRLLNGTKSSSSSLSHSVNASSAVSTLGLRAASAGAGSRPSSALGGSLLSRKR